MSVFFSRGGVMPDAGQYFIVVLLSFVNVICFRGVILKQKIESLYPYLYQYYLSLYFLF